MLERLKIIAHITDSAQDNILSELICVYTDMVLSYTKRESLIPTLETEVIRLALSAYNKLGAEGENSRSEGGISRSYDSELPESSKTVLNRYIKARVI